MKANFAPEQMSCNGPILRLRGSYVIGQGSLYRRLDTKYWGSFVENANAAP